MAKNVIITEGATGRRMPDVSKVLTVRPTSGSDLWVPVDERLSRQKYITKNGTFYATDEELYAFSKVTVNVPGGVQGVTTPTVTTPISNTSPDVIADINPYTGLRNDVNVSIEQPNALVSPTAMPQMNGIPGSTISGIDPDTGISYTVGVNPDGTISKSENPNAIHIVKTPDKMDYSEGETIDYTGIQVMLYKSYSEGPDGISAVPFRDDRYGDSLIPFDELIFPQSTASFVSGDVSIVTSDYHDTGTVYIDSISGGSIAGVVWVVLSNGDRPPIDNNSGLDAFWQGVLELSSEYDGCAAIAQCHWTRTNGEEFSFGSADYVAVNVFPELRVGSYASLDTVNTVVAGGSGASGVGGDSIRAHVSINGWDTYWPQIWASGKLFTGYKNGPSATYASNINARFLYANDVPVNWESPYDGRVLSDTFKLPMGGQQGSNEGYSGSGGGSF